MTRNHLSAPEAMYAMSGSTERKEFRGRIVLSGGEAERATVTLVYAPADAGMTMSAHARRCMGMAAENRRTRRVRRKTLGGVGERVDGGCVKRKHAGVVVEGDDHAECPCTCVHGNRSRALKDAEGSEENVGWGWKAH